MKRQARIRTYEEIVVEKVRSLVSASRRGPPCTDPLTLISVLERILTKTSRRQTVADLRAEIEVTK